MRSCTIGSATARSPEGTMMLRVSPFLTTSLPVSEVPPERHFSFYAEKDSLWSAKAEALATSRPVFADLSPRSIKALQTRERFVGFEAVPDAGTVGAKVGAAAGLAVGLLLAPVTAGISVAMGALAAPAGYLVSHAAHLNMVYETRPDRLEVEDFFTTGVVNTEKASRRLCFLLTGLGILDGELVVRKPEHLLNLLGVLATEDFGLQPDEFQRLKTFFKLFLQGMRA